MPHLQLAPSSSFILEFSLKSPQCFLNIPMAFPNHPWEYYDLSFIDTNKATPGRSRVHSLRLTCTNAAVTRGMNIEEWAPEDSGSPKGYRQPIPQSNPFQNRDCLCSRGRERWTEDVEPSADTRFQTIFLNPFLNHVSSHKGSPYWMVLPTLNN